jgi:hypothetical protein
MRSRNWLTKTGIWVLLAAALLLPLYELADYTEVWQHDGDLVVPGLFFLFSGMALLGGRTLQTAVILIVLAFIETEHFLERPLPMLFAAREVSASPPRLSLTLRICDLRI